MRATAGANAANSCQLTPGRTLSCGTPAWSGLGPIGRRSRTECGHSDEVAHTSPCRHAGRSGPRRAARVRKWLTWIGRLRWSAADRPTPLSRGAYLDETAGPGLLLAVQGYERDIQVMRSRDVHSVGATEPNLGS